MSVSIRFSPPRAFIDPNMIDANGLIPAAREFVTGSRRLGGFRVGQAIRAYDEDGNGYSGQIARVERHLLYLDITVRETNWRVEHSRYVNALSVAPGEVGRPDPSTATPRLELQTDVSRWVLA